jgi:hypothetical protein
MPRPERDISLPVRDNYATISELNLLKHYISQLQYHITFTYYTLTF